jgi:CDP-diacylglycerol---serine O-phosphatidyltransferase
VWFSVDHGLEGSEMWLFGSLLAAAMGILMVSNVRYYSFKEVDFKNRVPFVALIVVVLVFVVVSSHPPSVLFFGFLLYVISGPVITLYQLRRRRQQRRQQQS